MFIQVHPLQQSPQISGRIQNQKTINFTQLSKQVVLCQNKKHNYQTKLKASPDIKLTFQQSQKRKKVKQEFSAKSQLTKALEIPNSQPNISHCLPRRSPMIEYISRFDLFGSAVNLNINSFCFYRSKVGGLLSLAAAAVIILYLQSSKKNQQICYSICIFIIAILRIILNDIMVCLINLTDFIEFIQQEKLTVSSAQTYTTNPDAIDFGVDKLMFGINIFQSHYDFLTNPFFNIVLQIGEFTNAGGSQVKQKYTTIELEPCTTEHWKAYFDNNINDVSYDKEHISANYVCPKIDQVFRLQGQYLSKNFDFIRIDVKECVQSELEAINPNWKATCADKTTIQKQLASYGPMRVTVYQNNFIISPDKNVFAEPYLNQDLTYQFVPNSMFKSVDVFFRNYQVETTTNNIFGSSTETKNYIVNDYKDVTESTVLGTTSSVYSQVFFRRSPFSEVYKRTHETFTQFLSNLGGFINILITVIGLFMRRYNYFQFTVDLASKLYTFEMKEDNKDSKNLEPDSHQDHRQTEKTNDKQRQDKLMIPKKFSDRFSQNNIELTNRKDHTESDQFDIPISHSQMGFKHKEGKGTAMKTKLSSMENKNTSMEYSKNNLSRFQGTINSNRPLLLPSHSQIETNQSKKPSHLQFNREATRKKMWKVIKILNKPGFKIKIKSKLKQTFMKEELKKKFKAGQLHRKDYLIEQFQKIIHTTHNQMKSGFSFFFHFLTFNKAFNTPANEQLTQARRNINQDLDICVILNKLQELEKLKKIILNKEQSVLFAYNHKPVISNPANKPKEGMPEVVIQKQQPPQVNKQQETFPSEQFVEGQQTLNCLEQHEVSNHNQRITHFMNILFQKLYQAFEKIKDKEKQHGRSKQLKILMSSKNSILLKRFLGFLNVLKQQYCFENFQRVNRHLIKELGSEIYSVFQLSLEDSQEKKDDLNGQVSSVDNPKQKVTTQPIQNRIQISAFENNQNQESNFSSPIINNSFAVKIQQPSEEVTGEFQKLEEKNNTSNNNVTQVENEQTDTISFSRKNDQRIDKTVDSLAFDTIPDIPFEPLPKSQSNASFYSETTLKKIS